MAKFIVVFLCLAVIQASLALKCKRCKDPACKTLEDETCAASPTNMEAACLNHKYKEAAGKDVMVEKKCVSRDKSGKYECVKANPATEEEVKCQTCTEDFCNEKDSAPRMAALGAVVVIALLVPKFI